MHDLQQARTKTELAKHRFILKSYYIPKYL